MNNCCPTVAQPGCTAFTIYKGDDVEQMLQVFLNGDPVDLSGVDTDIEISLENEDGTFLELSLLEGGIELVSGGTLGKFNMIISTTESAALAEKDLADMDAVITIDDKIRTYRFYSALTVKARVT